jgi:hypothetical protein
VHEPSARAHVKTWMRAILERICAPRAVTV